MRRTRALHEVVWASATPPGWEYCGVRRAHGGWDLSGTAVRRFGQGTASITYKLGTDSRWRTRRVRIEQLFRGADAVLQMEARDGHWSVGGRARPDLEGCLDVDLEASPVTNTLPLKRTGLGVGSKVDLRAAWVRFPGLKVLALEQSYERLDEKLYRYRSASGFESEVEVDDFGLVKRYGSYWKAV